MSLLKVNDLKFYYHKDKITFHDVNITLEKGEILTILGPNGAGKTTLLNCLAGLITPVSGDIFLDERNVNDIPLREKAQIIGYVAQTHNAAYSYSVREFIVMGRAPYMGMMEKPKKSDYELTDRVMTDLGIMKFADQPYTEISGGERQQALIARAIVQQPEIIMFDEPTNHLDFGNQTRMVRKVRSLSQEGYAVIMTTHMPNHAMWLGGKTAILDRSGRLTVGYTDEVITQEVLEDIYQEKIRIVYVPEAGRKICIIERDD